MVPQLPRRRICKARDKDSLSFFSIAHSSHAHSPVREGTGQKRCPSCGVCEHARLLRWAKGRKLGGVLDAVHFSHAARVALLRLRFPVLHLCHCQSLRCRFYITPSVCPGAATSRSDGAARGLPCDPSEPPAARGQRGQQPEPRVNWLQQLVLFESAPLQRFIAAGEQQSIAQHAR